MEILQQRISRTLDDVISSEELIGDELKGIIQIFKKEKEKSGFPFGTLCVIHYEEYTTTYNQDIYKVAAAIELLISSFDIIDDLQDNDTNYIWMENQALSLNAVLAMMTIATKIIRRSTFNHSEFAIQIMEKYTLLSIDGQQLDLLNVCRDESSYLKMIEKKSGSLTIMSCLIGTALAQGKVLAEVELYSKSIGVIQQIKNDIQDLKEWNLKNDLLNKRYTLPIIYLFSLEDGISEILENYYKKNILFDNHFILETLISSGAIRYTITIKNLYKNKALDIIQNTNLSTRTKDHLKKYWNEVLL